MFLGATHRSGSGGRIACEGFGGKSSELVVRKNWGKGMSIFSCAVSGSNTGVSESL